MRLARIAFVVAAIFTFAMASLPHPPVVPNQPSDKIMHVLTFTTLGALAALGFRKIPIEQLFLGLAAFGAIIELVQAIPVLHRNSELADLWADMAGALVALAATRWLLNWWERREGG